MSSPLVSVIIPTYNRAGVICETIENVFEQTYSNIEIIVVDDGSTDDTLSRLRSFGKRIRIVSQANAGPAAARNRGIEVSLGKIIAFQDSDDLWIPNKLERQVSILQRSGPVVPCCICNANMYFTGRPPITSFELAGIRVPLEQGIWTNVAEVLATTFVLFNQCAAVRADVLKSIGGFDESMRFLEDYDLPLRLTLEGNSWAFIREPLVVWQQGSPGSMWKKAMDEEVCMHECALKCLQAFAEAAKSKGEIIGLKKILRKELKRRRRELAAARISKMDVLGASVVGMAFKRIERYRKAIYRRTPWYPVMEVIALTG
jgi:glycosyltransferase involved in cell wall biosynthesis